MWFDTLYIDLSKSQLKAITMRLTYLVMNECDHDLFPNYVSKIINK